MNGVGIVWELREETEELRGEPCGELSEEILEELHGGPCHRMCTKHCEECVEWCGCWNE